MMNKITSKSSRKSSRKQMYGGFSINFGNVKNIVLNEDAKILNKSLLFSSTSEYDPILVEQNIKNHKDFIDYNIGILKDAKISKENIIEYLKKMYEKDNYFYTIAKNLIIPYTLYYEDANEDTYSKPTIISMVKSHMKMIRELRTGDVIKDLQPLANNVHDWIKPVEDMNIISNYILMLQLYNIMKKEEDDANQKIRNKPPKSPYWGDY